MQRVSREKATGEDFEGLALLPQGSGWHAVWVPLAAVCFGCTRVVALFLETIHGDTQSVQLLQGKSMQLSR